MYKSVVEIGTLSRITFFMKDGRKSMARKREFGEGPIYTITNYIYWLFMGTVYFALCNLLFLFVAFTPIQNNDSSVLVLFVISLIPAGPAITALLSAMGKLVRDKDVNITKDYFKAYKENFKQSLQVWLMLIAVLCILFVDITFFNKKAYGLFFVPFMYAAGIIALLMSFYAFPLISRFYLRTRDVIRLSFYYAITKIKVTLMNISVIILAVFVLKINSISIFFIASAMCYLIMFYEKDLLKQIEEQVLTNDSNATKQEDEENHDEDKIFSDKRFDQKK
jgi:Predicted integral membrane protein